MKQQSRYAKTIVASIVALVVVGIARFVVVFQIYDVAGEESKAVAIARLDNINRILNTLTAVAGIAAIVLIVALVLEFADMHKKKK